MKQLFHEWLYEKEDDCDGLRVVQVQFPYAKFTFKDTPFYFLKIRFLNHWVFADCRKGVYRLTYYYKYDMPADIWDFELDRFSSRQSLYSGIYQLLQDLEWDNGIRQQ